MKSEEKLLSLPFAEEKDEVRNKLRGIASADWILVSFGFASVCNIDARTTEQYD